MTRTTLTRLFIASLFIATVALTGNARTLRVLAIGNSFSEDAVEQNLYELAAAQGDTLIIGNAYIGGCSIDRHYNNIVNDIPDYRYRKIEGGKTVTINSQPLSKIIPDEPWDIITLQQASHFSGEKSTYANLPALKERVKELMPNKNAEIVWHMTWAYAKDFNSDNFNHYGRNQQVMYDSINAIVATVIPANDIERVIPSGVAIQNARGHFGDVLNRDGYHLAIPLGRYTAACTWCEFLTGKPVTENNWHPEGMTDADAAAARKAAHEALAR